jgi:Cytochrome P450
MPGADDIDRLCFTDAVVYEAMRLYPPAWSLERDAIDADAVAGISVAARTTVVVPPNGCTGTRSSGQTRKVLTQSASWPTQTVPATRLCPLAAESASAGGFAMFAAKLMLASSDVTAAIAYFLSSSETRSQHRVPWRDATASVGPRAGWAPAVSSCPG